MIIVLATIKYSGSDIDNLREAIIDNQKASASEAGCISYTFTTEIGDPNTVRVIEQWETMDDLKAHFATAHMAEFQQAMSKFPAKSLDVKLYEVAQELESPWNG